MAKPTQPSIGTRILYYGALPPVATFYVQQPSGAKIYNPLPSPNSPPDIAAGSVAPALVVALGGTAPDYIGMAVSVHGPDGSVSLRQGMLNIATCNRAARIRPSRGGITSICPPEREPP